MKEEVKRRMMAAMKAGDVIEKEILRVVRGELDTAESRSDGPLSQEESERVVRKIIKNNEETLSHVQDDEQRRVLTREVEILSALLPKMPTVDELKTHLATVMEQIRAAGNDGQATGVAMKHLKTLGLTSDGKTVGAAVKALRQ